MKAMPDVDAFGPIFQFIYCQNASKVYLYLFSMYYPLNQICFS